jgi:hypothetical protein
VQTTPEPIDRNTALLRDVSAAAPLTMGQHARRFVMVSVTILLTACSSVQLGYNNADILVAYSLDNYLDLDDEQERLARERIDALLRWHRSTQLREYAAVLADAQSRVAGQVSAAEVREFNRQINRGFAAIADRAAPDLAQLALTLRPAQVERLAERLDRDTSKARRELVRFAGPESAEQRIERAFERAEEWLGPLSTAQRDLIRSSLDRRPDAQAAWMEERERRQRDLVAVLTRIRSEQPPQATATAWLREYFADVAEPRDAQRRARVEQIRGDNAALIAQLVNSATPAQRATLTKKLRSYADDFDALAAQAASGRGG